MFHSNLLHLLIFVSSLVTSNSQIVIDRNRRKSHSKRNYNPNFSLQSTETARSPRALLNNNLNLPNVLPEVTLDDVNKINNNPYYDSDNYRKLEDVNSNINLNSNLNFNPNTNYDDSYYQEGKFSEFDDGSLQNTQNLPDGSEFLTKHLPNPVSNNNNFDDEDYDTEGSGDNWLSNRNNNDYDNYGIDGDYGNSNFGNNNENNPNAVDYENPNNRAHTVNILIFEPSEKKLLEYNVTSLYIQFILEILIEQFQLNSDNPDNKITNIYKTNLNDHIQIMSTWLSYSENNAHVKYHSEILQKQQKCKACKSRNTDFSVNKDCMDPHFIFGPLDTGSVNSLLYMTESMKIPMITLSPLRINFEY